MTLRRRASFALLPSLLAFLGAEIGSRVALDAIGPPVPFADRLANPAWTARPWFSATFASECAVQPGRWTNPPGTRLVLPGDWSSPSFHVSGGRRLTAGNPRTGRLVWCLGGSTTYCAEVPDALTWPSLLRAKLVPGWRVENLGATSVTAAQELERLRAELRTETPDVVVALDGVNDAFQSVYYGHPQGWIAGEEVATALDPPLLAITRLRARLFPSQVPRPEHMRGQISVALLARAAAWRWRASVEAMRSECQAHGIRFVHLLQPCLATKYPRTTHDAVLDDRLRSENPARSEALEFAYNVMRPITDVDATGALEAVRDPVYLDDCHVNDLGNERIAERVRLAIAEERP